MYYACVRYICIHRSTQRRRCNVQGDPSITNKTCKRTSIDIICTKHCSFQRVLNETFSVKYRFLDNGLTSFLQNVILVRSH